MIWVAVVGGIALMGLVAVAVSARMVTHKVADVTAEVDMVRGRVQEFGDLVGQLDLPPRSHE